MVVVGTTAAGRVFNSMHGRMMGGCRLRLDASLPLQLLELHCDLALVNSMHGVGFVATMRLGAFSIQCMGGLVVLLELRLGSWRRPRQFDSLHGGWWWR